MRLVIDRSRWLRGTGNGVLLDTRDNREKMCCLGFACEVLGVDKNEMHKIGTPQELNKLLPGLTEVGSSTGQYDFRNISGVVDEAIYWNDGPGISDEQREPMIKKILGQAGLEVEFVDGV